MADEIRAADRLERLLHIFPAASVEGGVALDALARDLDVERATVLDDLTEVTARSYYHPAGSGDEIQIHLEADRVTVWTSGAFQRPVKLGPTEAFCLSLGLRRQGLERAVANAPGDADGSVDPEALLRRVEAHLSWEGVPDRASGGLHARDVGADPDGIRELLVDGARDGLCCRIRYLKPSEPEPEDRVIQPHAVAHAEGRWYVVGWCETSEGARAFRLDRILDAELGSRDVDEAAEEVDVDAFLEGGRVFHAREETEVVVRYTPVVARWVEEWAPEADARNDGSLIVRHRVADPEWVVRHVLSYGGEAEVVEPEGMRGLLRDQANQLG